ncbi:MAG: VgrG-related protein [Anaerolineaceae bacterium]
MPGNTDISHLSIKIDGAPASEDVSGHLTDAVIDHSLHLPSMFTLRLHNPNMKWLDDETFREGKKIEIEAGDPPVKLLSGRIAALEPELDQASPALIVRGYDLSHILYRGRKRRSFNNVTDADLARTLAQESGLRPGQIDDPPGAPYDYVYQNNQTNAEFLLERARRLGFEFYVEEDALHFHKPAPTGQAVTLAWGETLRNFRARLSTAEQVNEVEVRGWDPDKKTKIEGRATTGNGAPQIGIPQPGADIAKNTWGEAKIAIVNQFVRSPSEADTLAQAALDELASSFVEAEGVCDGNPAVVPGKQVQIQGVGNRFNGQYYVTQAIHEWNKDQGMFTRFVVSGLRDHNILSIVEGSSSAKKHVPGVVVGLVSNNQDPSGLGRLRVKFPWLSDNDESAWAPMATPMTGNGRGFQYVPEIDDEVLVAFEHGDIDRPYVIGCLWNGMDKPPLQPSDAVGGGGVVNKRIIKSRSGHIILLDDTQGNEEISIEDKNGNKIVLHSPDNSLEIKVQGNLTIEAQGSVKISGLAGLEIGSNTTMSIKGSAGATIEGTGTLTLKNGAGAEIDLSGPSVNVNNGALEVT